MLRRVRNVKELKGNLNTQKDEQLHLQYNHDTRYLNQMKPVDHIFLFRSNIDIHNERINRHQKDGLRAAFKHEIKVDENGRAVLDKTIKLVVKGKRNIAGDMDDDDAQHTTPKKMKPESSDQAILKMSGVQKINPLIPSKPLRRRWSLNHLKNQSRVQKINTLIPKKPLQQRRSPNHPRSQSLVLKMTLLTLMQLCSARYLWLIVTGSKSWVSRIGTNTSSRMTSS